MKLSTPIGTLLPASVVENLLVVGGVDYGPEIQVGELLQQVSGLPDYWSSPEFIQAFDADVSRVWYPDELVAYAKAMTPIGIPSQTWHYADTNYVLLGMIIETVTGQPLEEVFRQRILGPLGMSETYLAYHEPAVSPRQESHRFEFAEDLYAQPRQSTDWAGGGLVSSNADLQKFMRGLFQGRLFERSQTVDLMKTSTDTGAAGVAYALGLFRVNLGAGEGHLWGHDGWGNSFMYYWPEQDIGFTGALNQVDNDWYPLVETAIAQRLLVSGPGNDLEVPGTVHWTLPLNARLSDGATSSSVSPSMALSLDVTDSQLARIRPGIHEDGQESSADARPRGDARLVDKPSDGPNGGQAPDVEAGARVESEHSASGSGYLDDGFGSVALVPSLRRLRWTTPSLSRWIEADGSLLCEAERYSLLHLLSAIELPSFAAEYRSRRSCPSRDYWSQQGVGLDSGQRPARQV